MSAKQRELSPTNMQLQANQQLNLTQKLIMSSHMQQALHLLQLPLIELEPFIEEQVVTNPILEIASEADLEEDNEEESISDADLSILSRLEEDIREHSSSDTLPVKRSAEEEKLKAFQENSICSQLSLYDHLIQEAHETFEVPADLTIAEILIGYIDAFGFMKTPLSEIASLHGLEPKEIERILKEIQAFEPYGVGASSVQESLLIQLRCLGKEKTLAYQIIQHHYDELLHNQLPAIQKSLKCSFKELESTIEHDIAKLDLHPGTHFSSQVVQVIVPDVTIRQENDKLIVDVDQDRAPSLRLNHQYLQLLRDPETPSETIQFLKRHLFSARWLMRNLQHRYSTIERIAQILAVKQYAFFISPEGQLDPMTMKWVADELNLHESTIARTVANKYLNSPRGIFPLRSFFTNKYVTDEGEILSSKTVKEAILQIMDKEDKCHPLSDAKMSVLLKEMGIVCARRTVAKFRQAFGIGNTQQRKKFKL